MDEEYNVIAGDDNEDTLQYDDVETVEQPNVLCELNGVGRRSVKRRLTDFGKEGDEGSPIDWHLRVPLSLEDLQSKRQKIALEDEIICRVTNKILEARVRRSLGDANVDGDYAEEVVEQILRTPPIDGTPWIGVSSDGNDERFYLRFHRKRQSKPSFDENRSSLPDQLTSRQLFEEADSIRAKIVSRKLNNTDEIEELLVDRVNSKDQTLWVNKYKPNSFAELLGDDGINRCVVTWLKLWDECVFKKKINIEALTSEKERVTYDLDTAKIRRPLQKILLLSGPAGLGKSTLATIIARHCGYSVVEVNASDSRNVQDFDRVIEGAVRSVKTLDSSKRPNCLILDEIDGAPVEAIRFLVKAIQVTGKKMIRRPIICICNNLFTSSLRELRSIALNIAVLPTKKERLVTRLTEICQKEKLRIENRALVNLIELCHSDVRNALNILQFLASLSKSENRMIKLKDIEKAAERERFGNTSLFDNWASVLETSRHLNSKGMINSEKQRLHVIERISMESGDERFVSGLHANYLSIPLPIRHISYAMESFLFYDKVTRCVAERQNYTLMKYLYAFYSLLHLTVASHNRLHLKYPQFEQNVVLRHKESQETVATVRSKLTHNNNPASLVLDILPLIVITVQPVIKTVNERLYTQKEIALMSSAVSVMISYNLSYSSTTSSAGQVEYIFNPPIDILTMYDLTDVSHRTCFTSSQRYQIMKKIEETLTRVAIMGGNPLSVDPVTNTKKIFAMADEERKVLRNVPMHFKFNQGYSNAVKRNIRMCNLIS